MNRAVARIENAKHLIIRGEATLSPGFSPANKSRGQSGLRALQL